MRAYSSMSTTDFIAQIRDIAIRAGARALVIDQIDAIVEGPTQEEVDQQINDAVEEAERTSYDEGHREGELGKERAVEDAEKQMHADCIAAIEARGTEIGLDEQQIYKIVNHILWDVRP